MRRAIAAGVVVFAVALARSLADGFGLVDESWFLQVIARMRAGDVLYRDVFLGTTPLSAYVTLAVTYVVGVEIVAVKIVTSACFAASAVLAMTLARRAGVPALPSVAVLAAVVVWGRPYANPPYTSLAMALFMAALAKTPGVFLTTQKDARRLWLFSGVLAGLAFGAKQNVGLLALAAVAVTWFVAARKSRGSGDASRGGLAIVAGFAGAAALVLAPVAWSGGLPALWDYGFAGKGDYLALGGVAYPESLDAWIAAVSSPLSSANPGAALHGGVVALPIVVLIVAVVSARRLDRRAWVLVALAALATLSALPRWDRFHMAYAVPMHAVALATMAAAWHGAGARRFTTVVSTAVMALAVIVAVRPVDVLVQGGREPSSMPHFRGPLIAPADQARLEAAGARIRREAAGLPVFILSLEAGFWHLASGVSNPTPFDIPAATALGATGLSWLAPRLADGGIPQVCIDRRRQDRLVLTEIAARVEATFERGPDVGPCTWYRARGER